MNWKCFNRYKHTYSKWVYYSVLVQSIEDKVRIKRVQLRQRRQCIDCGFTQDRHVAFTNNERELNK